MKILIFSWKDIKTPFAGGAEVYTYEICKRLVAKGHSITLLTPKFKNCIDCEIIDGIKIVRYAGKYTIYIKARNYYRKYLQEENFDIIIDQINTLPFFTVNFIDNNKIICLIHQLSREFWFHETIFPINFLGYYLENNYIKKYKNICTITVSNSTADDLRKLGFKKRFIVYNGFESNTFTSMNKIKDNFLLLFIGRLTKSKKPIDAIKAFKIVNEKFPDAKLSIIGDGYLRKSLIKFSNSLNCSKNIAFHGFLSEKEKFTILNKSNLLLVPGVREGWGRVVTEANSVGVPAIGYNIHGLRDSIIDGETGLLCEPNPEGMAKKIIEFLEDKNLQDKLARNALEYSCNFSWDKSAEEFEKILENIFYE